MGHEEAYSQEGRGALGNVGNIPEQVEDHSDEEAARACPIFIMNIQSP